MSAGRIGQRRVFHAREDLRAEIARLSKLPRCAARHPELRRQRGTSRARYGLRKLICAIQQCRRGPSLALGMTMVLYLGTCAAELLRARYSPKPRASA